MCSKHPKTPQPLGEEPQSSTTDRYTILAIQRTRNPSTLEPPTSLLRNPANEPSEAKMISDNSLYSLAIFLGSLAMMLIVLYHFLEINAQDDKTTTPLTAERKADALPAKAR